MRGSALETLGRWRPEGATPSRARFAIALNLVPAGLAIFLFALVAPPADWSHPELFGALAAIAAVAFLAEARLKLAVPLYFDATIVLALLALVIAGPLPALLVWVVPDAISRLVARQDPILSPGLSANVTSFSFALLAGYGVLQLAAAPSMVAAAPALYTAGLVMWAVNFVFARLTFAPFYQGCRLGPLIRSEFLDLAPVVLSMLLLAVATAVLIPPLGVFALALLAAVVVLPQVALWALVRERSVAGLSRTAATTLYAEALADVLRLSRDEQRVIACTTELLTGESNGGGEPTGGWRFEDVPEVVQATLHVDERWDGTGRPAGLRCAHTPLASRVLAVARAWSELTAGGTLELPHTEAILGLSARAGTEFDPAIVRAAAQVVAEEQAFVRDPGFAPRLHRLPLPHPLRRVKLPTVLAHLTKPA